MNLNRQLRARIIGEVAAAQSGAPDPSLLEMSRRIGASHGAVRITLMRMERRGIVRRACRGVYRLPVQDERRVE